jgi:hypothetical protein
MTPRCIPSLLYLFLFIVITAPPALPAERRPYKQRHRALISMLAEGHFVQQEMLLWETAVRHDERGSGSPV